MVYIEHDSYFQLKAALKDFFLYQQWIKLHALQKELIMENSREFSLSSAGLLSTMECYSLYVHCFGYMPT